MSSEEAKTKSNVEEVKTTKPDENKFKEDTQRIQNEIDTLDGKIREVNKKISNARRKSKDKERQVRSTRGRLAKLQRAPERLCNDIAKLEAKMSEVSAQMDKKNSHNQEIKDRIQSALGTTRFGRNIVHAVDEKIQNLEYAQKTTSMSLKEEKELVKQIAALRKLKATSNTLSLLSTSRETQELRILRTKISKLNGQINDSGNRVERARADLEKLQGELQAERGDVIKALEKKISEMRSQLQQKRKEKRERGDEYFAALRGFKKYLDDRRKERLAEERERKKAEEKKYQDELKKWEEEEAKKKPWLTEIGECERIIEYLKPMIPKKVVSKVASDDDGTKSVLKLADGTVLEPMCSKKGSDSLGFSTGKRKKKKKRRRNKDQDRPIKHSIDIIATFKKMGISLPKYMTEASESLEQAKAKLEYWDKLPRPEKKKAEKKKKSSKNNVSEEKKVALKEEKIAEDTKTNDEQQQQSASNEYDEYVCYDDDACMGKNAPSLANLDYVQGNHTKYSEKPTVVLFWAKFLKWQVYPAMKACEVLHKSGIVNVVGVATDPKRSAIERHIEKGECPTTYALCFDESDDTPGGKVKNIFKKSNDDELKVPQVFLINTKGKIVWHQAFTSGRPYEKTNFDDQVKMFCKTGKLKMNGPAPVNEESSDEEEEAANESGAAVVDPLSADVDW